MRRAIPMLHIRSRRFYTVFLPIFALALLLTLRNDPLDATTFTTLLSSIAQIIGTLYSIFAAASIFRLQKIDADIAVMRETLVAWLAAKRGTEPDDDATVVAVHAEAATALGRLEPRAERDAPRRTAKLLGNAIADRDEIAYGFRFAGNVTFAVIVAGFVMMAAAPRIAALGWLVACAALMVFTGTVALGLIIDFSTMVFHSGVRMRAQEDEDPFRAFSPRPGHR